MSKSNGKKQPLDTNRIIAANDEEKSTALHEELGMTPAEVRADLINQGLDPATEAEALRRMGRALFARYGSRGPAIEANAAWMGKSFPRYEESASAGAAVWSAPAAVPERSSFMDILERADTTTAMWIRVKGWSMRDAGLQDGDMALVDTAATPRDGDIVVAHIAGEGVVVKRLRLRRDGVALESANPDFSTIELADPSELRVQGVVIGRGGKI